MHYHITLSTHIVRVRMKNLLSHAKTKMELAEYLAQETTDVRVHKGRREVVAWRSECKGTREDFLIICKATMKRLTRLLYILLTPHPEVRLIFGYIPPRPGSQTLFKPMQTPCSSQAQGGTIGKSSFIQSIEL